jgi:chemotaxis protein MotB
LSRKKKHEHVNHERWLVSYADFITLLFAFFVVLFASSQADKKKQSAVAAAMQSAFTPMGSFESHTKTPPIADNSVAPQVTRPAAIALPLPPAGSTRLEETEGRIQKLLHAEATSGGIPPGSVTARMTREGLIISLNEVGFFASGSAEVRASALDMLSALAATLPDSPVRIEGHTDNVPIHTTQYATNWELSTARASAIARLLLDHSKIRPVNLSAAGYAEFHPVASNATEEGRSKNRRVDIILLRDRAPSQ